LADTLKAWTPTKLDILSYSAQKHGKVFPLPSSFYAQWRAQRGLVSVLREDAAPPPEKLLQSIWQHQRLQRAQLKTLDGQTVRILHPGFLSVEGGPDFRGAVVQFGDAPPISGDVEVDLRTSGWHAHGHDKNPAFEKVILHVIWDGVGTPSTSSARFNSQRAEPVLGVPPALPIHNKLDAPLSELSLWLNSDAAESFPEALRGQCCAPLSELSAEKLTELLQQAAQIRFRSKAAQFNARARQAGWEQTLWEGIFRALGYKQNVWPMQCLAEQRARWLNANGAHRVARPAPLILQSRLLGLGSLLPAELTRAQASTDGYLRRVWDQWWREREELADCVLPRTLWKFHGQRPANHPQRRLALAAHWLANGNLVSRIERWATTDSNKSETSHSSRNFAESLLEILQIERDDFWSWHWTIRSPRLQKAQPLLGATRVTDLAVNVILPWLWIRAAEGKNSKLQREIEQRFNAWPAAEDNSVLRLARQRLLGGAGRRALKTAAEQQGLMQIVRDFCEHSNAVCENCRFPELVSEFKSQ
jgi:hypothetical protein